MAKEIYMEDVGKIAQNALTNIENQLICEFGITVSEEVENALYVVIKDALEKTVGYPDYRNHN